MFALFEAGLRRGELKQQQNKTGGTYRFCLFLGFVRQKKGTKNGVL